MDLSDLVLQKEYHYKDIEDLMEEGETEVHEYGEEIYLRIGTLAIHIRDKDTEIDYWFVFSRYGNGSYYKFVFKG
jgi:hypothetical protein